MKIFNFTAVMLVLLGSILFSGCLSTSSDDKLRDNVIVDLGDEVGIAPANFTEVSTENTNIHDGGAAAQMGLKISPGDEPLIIAGSIAHDEGTSVEADSDFFEFVVEEEMILRATLSWDTEETSAKHAISIYRADPNREIVVWRGMTNTGIVSTNPVTLSTDTYWINVSANNPAPSTPVEYQVTIEEAPPGCVSAGDPPDYTEADESLDNHQANDALSVVWFEGVDPRLTSLDGTVEQTGLVVDSLGEVSIVGHTADVSPRDDYFDRDVFEIRTGDATQELFIRLDHAYSNLNMDIFVFPATASELMLGSGTSIRRDGDAALLNVEPNQRYWVWVGAFDESSYISHPSALSTTYRLTICGR